MKDLETVETFAIELDKAGVKSDEKNKKQYFLEIKNVESYYNIRTIGLNFEIMTSYLALENGSFFSLFDSKFSSTKSNFKANPSEELFLDPVSIQAIQNKRKFLYYIIKDNSESSKNLKNIFGDYLTSVAFTPKHCKERKRRFIFLFECDNVKFNYFLLKECSRCKINTSKFANLSISELPTTPSEVNKLLSQHNHPASRATNSHGRLQELHDHFISFHNFS